MICLLFTEHTDVKVGCRTAIVVVNDALDAGSTLNVDVRCSHAVGDNTDGR